MGVSATKSRRNYLLMRNVSPWRHFGVVLTLLTFSLFNPEADTIFCLWPLTYLIFLLLFLICPSLPSLVPANWIVSLQMVLEASPCKLDASPSSPSPYPIFFFPPCTHSSVLMCAHTSPRLIQAHFLAACSQCVSKGEKADSNFFVSFFFFFFPSLWQICHTSVRLFWPL